MPPMTIPRLPSGPKRLIILIMLLVLLPVLFFSAYQIGTYSSSEEIMRDLYRRQLDVMLTSVNQHTWDISTHWATMLQVQLIDPGKPMEDRVRSFLSRTPVVDAVILADSAGKNLQLFARSDSSRSREMEDSLAVQLRSQSEHLEQLVHYRSLDYQKLEPLILPGPRPGEQRIALIFANDPALPLPRFGGMVFGDITKLLAEQISTTAGEEFVMAVYRKGGSTPVAASGSIAEDEIVQRRNLWTFPDHEIVIAAKGTTIDQIVHGRLVRNIVLIVIVNLLLFAGVGILYRNVRAEVELAHAKSTFVSNVSHELRTPLALIRMFAETLEMGRLKDEAKKQEYYRTILRETERLTHLVNNLLNFSRMEAGRKPYQLVPGSLATIIRDVVSMYMPHLTESGFTPVVELPEDEKTLLLDRDAISEALINLLDNAVKYSDTDKFLTVRLLNQGQEISVAVEDHGIGIAAQYHGRIFEPFFRVPSGFVHDTKGSGLGLSLVKHIMNAHGGRIDLQSTPGKGTTVRLIFPLTPSK
jgi:two-component system, OmpR family, phosphate regulon sensor histidine kinase PhoR